MSDKKHFDQGLPKACAYCINGVAFSGGAEIFCRKKGVVEPFDNCRSYKYDPLKRTPKVKDIGRDYKPEDFKL